MAKMVGYACSIKLQWLNMAVQLLKENLSETEYKEKMNEYLRPSTLFRPLTSSSLQTFSVTNKRSVGDISSSPTALLALLMAFSIFVESKATVLPSLLTIISGMTDPE